MNWFAKLGLRPGELSSTRIRQQLKKFPQYRKEAKGLLDKFYGPLYARTLNEESLTEAGFFDDQLSHLDYGLQIPTTPVDKLMEATSQSPVVLLSTGGFAPVHEGHLASMELTKQHLEQLGYEVIGGYFSPSHDNYVQNKYYRGKHLNIYEKVQLLQEKVKDSSWLMVDLWEGIYTPGPVNFTDCILRLQQYLWLTKKIKVKICYVCGSDNSGFARAFQGTDYLISVVQRSGSEALVQKVHQELQDEPNILWIKDNPYPDKSSRTINHNFSLEIKGVGPYLLRDDLSLVNYLTPSQKEYALSVIQEALAQATGKAVEVLPGREQQKYGEQLTQQWPTISLDPLVPGTYNLAVSRLFNMTTLQDQSNQLIPRPHFGDIQSQIKQIPPGEYILIEDDIASGFTVNYVQKLLPATIKILAIKTLTEYSWHQKFSQDTTFAFYDIVDARDFIFGSLHGGLVLKIPNGKIGRGLYALPMVNLTTRAKVPPGAVINLSRTIWHLNYELFKHSNLQLQEIDLYTQNLFMAMGFKLEDLVSDICKYFQESLC